MLREQINDTLISEAELEVEHESELLNILKELDKIEMTWPILIATKLGRVLTRLKNRNNGKVGKMADKMMNDWKWIMFDHEKQEAIKEAVDEAVGKVVKEVKVRLGQGFGNGQPLPAPSQPTFETSTPTSSEQSLEARRYLLKKFEYAMLDNKGVQKTSFEKLFQEKKYFEIKDTLYRSWLHLKLDAVGTESEAFDAILKERMIKNVPKRKKKRVMNEPEGVDRHMPQSEAWKQKLGEIEERKKKKIQPKEKIQSIKKKMVNGNNNKKNDNRRVIITPNNDQESIKNNNNETQNNNIGTIDKKATKKDNVDPKVKGVPEITDLMRKTKKRKIVQSPGGNEDEAENDAEPKKKRLRKKTIPFTA